MLATLKEEGAAYDELFFDYPVFFPTLAEPVSRRDEVDPDQTVKWRAGLACSRAFNSPVIEQLCQQRDINAGQYLTEYINQCASEQPR